MKNSSLLTVFITFCFLVTLFVVHAQEPAYHWWVIRNSRSSEVKVTLTTNVSGITLGKVVILPTSEGVARADEQGSGEQRSSQEIVINIPSQYVAYVSIALGRSTSFVLVRANQPLAHMQGTKRFTFDTKVQKYAVGFEVARSSLNLLGGLGVQLLPASDVQALLASYNNQQKESSSYITETNINTSVTIGGKDGG